jgi:hypothetical protein
MPWPKAWACSLHKKDMAIRLQRIAMPPGRPILQLATAPGTRSPFVVAAEKFVVKRLWPSV